MNEEKNLVIIWESITGGGVNSYLEYLLNCKSFKKIKIIIYTNKNNSGAKELKSKLKKKIIFRYYKSYFTIKRKIFFKVFFFFLKPYFMFLTYLKFIEILKKHTKDAIIFQCGNYGRYRSEQAAVIAAKKLKIKNTHMVIHHECLKPLFFSKIIFYLINNNIKFYLKSIIAVSYATLKTIKENSNLIVNNNSSVIYNGIPIKKKNKINFLNKYLSSKNKQLIKIGIVSRLVRSKGHEDIIEAIFKLPENYKSKIIIFIIGKDYENYQSKLKKLVFEHKLKNFIFLNKLNIDSHKIMSSLDLLISATRDYEGFGLSIVEGMSVGTPVICTNVGAVTEYAKNSYCTLITPGDSNLLKNKIIDFCDNRISWKKKSFAAKKIILKKFNIDDIANRYLKIIYSNG